MTGFQKLILWCNFLGLLILASMFADINARTSAISTFSPTEQSSYLQTQVSALDARLANTETMLGNVNAEVFNLKFYPVLRNKATFSPSEEGFQKIETSVGDVFVSLQNIEKYADGFKITFHIGNPYSADILNAHAVLSYGQPYESYLEELTPEQKSDYSKAFTDWQATLKTSEKDLKKDISPRAWNEVSFIVSPAKEKDVGMLQLNLTATGLSLYTLKQ